MRAPAVFMQSTLALFRQVQGSADVTFVRADPNTPVVSRNPDSGAFLIDVTVICDYCTRNESGQPVRIRQIC